MCGFSGVSFDRVPLRLSGACSCVCVCVCNRKYASESMLLHANGNGSVAGIIIIARYHYNVI